MRILKTEHAVKKPRCHISSIQRPGPGCSKLDIAIHRMNHYPADKYQGNQLRYPLDRFLSGG